MINEEKAFRNFFEMNVEPKLKRIREGSKSDRTTWDNPRIIMQYSDRVYLYLAEVGGPLRNKEFEKIGAVHDEMRRLYDETVAIIGGE